MVPCLGYCSLLRSGAEREALYVVQLLSKQAMGHLRTFALRTLKSSVLDREFSVAYISTAIHAPSVPFNSAQCKQKRCMQTKRFRTDGSSSDPFFPTQSFRHRECSQLFHCPHQNNPSVSLVVQDGAGSDDCTLDATL
uniref:Uncharacterized protein n=1 Tax=Anopheles funestus TaxID=62324 RepID=A0A182S1H6_ANOFN